MRRGFRRFLGVLCAVAASTALVCGPPSEAQDEPEKARPEEKQVEGLDLIRALYATHNDDEVIRECDKLLRLGDNPTAAFYKERARLRLESMKEAPEQEPGAIDPFTKALRVRLPQPRATDLGSTPTASDQVSTAPPAASSSTVESTATLAPRSALAPAPARVPPPPGPSRPSSLGLEALLGVDNLMKIGAGVLVALTVVVVLVVVLARRGRKRTQETGVERPLPTPRAGADEAPSPEGGVEHYPVLGPAFSNLADLKPAETAPAQDSALVEAPLGAEIVQAELDEASVFATIEAEPSQPSRSPASEEKMDLRQAADVPPAKLSSLEDTEHPIDLGFDLLADSEVKTEAPRFGSAAGATPADEVEMPAVEEEAISFADLDLIDGRVSTQKDEAPASKPPLPSSVTVDYPEESLEVDLQAPLEPVSTSLEARAASQEPAGLELDSEIAFVDPQADTERLKGEEAPEKPPAISLDELGLLESEIEIAELEETATSMQPAFQTPLNTRDEVIELDEQLGETVAADALPDELVRFSLDSEEEKIAEEAETEGLPGEETTEDSALDAPGKKGYTVRREDGKKKNPNGPFDPRR